jgi:hypothetical protein
LSTAGAAESRQDASWVTIDTPLGLAELRLFCDDVERLYRINPYLEIQAWRPIGANEFRVTWRNLSNDQAATLELRREVESENEFSIACSAGIKRRTRFSLEPAAGGSRLVLTDDYASLPEEERVGRLAEVDKSLTAWGWALHAHLRREHRWGSNPAWRWAVRRFWLPMRPAARRIAVLIVLASLAEFAFFLLVALIWWIEHRE